MLKILVMELGKLNIEHTYFKFLVVIRPMASLAHCLDDAFQ